MLLFAPQRAPVSPSAVTLPRSQDTEVNETTYCFGLGDPWNFDEAKAKITCPFFA